MGAFYLLKGNIVMKRIYVLSLPFLFLTSTAFAGTINLPKTGQTKCYDTVGVEIPCAGTGQDGAIQAGVAWPSPRFTNPDGTTPITGDVVLDRLTGLMWTKNANLPGQKTWQQGLDYVTGMNAGTYPNYGYTDWCLPNVNELESLVNAAESNTATWLSNQGFINVQSYDYWSSTLHAQGTDGAWIVNMWDGVVRGYVTSHYDGYVWPVRGEVTSQPAPIWKTGKTVGYYAGDDGYLQRGVAWPVPRFTDNKDGTITDNLTGLMWTQDANLANDQKTWQASLDYVAGMNTGMYPNYGYTDWRLPNRKELRSLTDYSSFNPMLSSDHPFINLQIGNDYWSSTTYAYIPEGVWAIFIWDGILGADSKPNGNYVWPVRGGQIECSTWTDVISKYNAYVSGQAVWDDVIVCYQQYASMYGCTIDWSGYNYSYDYPESGSVRTSETSMTEQAALEARDAIFGGCDDGSPYVEDMGCSYNCCTCAYSHYVLSEYSHACLDGQYLQNSVYITESGPVFTTLRQGTWIVTCQTLVELSSFSATLKAGNVLLEWATTSEIDAVSFNFYRAESEDGEYVKINSSLIPPEGSPTQGASYEFTDRGMKNRTTYY